MSSLPPLPDVNLMFCGLATIAASVGFAFSRKFSSSTATTPSVDSTRPAEEKTPELLSSPQDATTSANSSTADLSPTENLVAQAIDCEKQTLSITPQEQNITTVNSKQTLAPEHERPSLKRKKMDDQDESSEGPDSSLEHPNKRSRTPPADEPAPPPEEQKPVKPVPSPNEVLLDNARKCEETAGKSTVLAPSPQLLYSPNFSGGFASFAGTSSPFLFPSPELNHSKPAWATEKPGENVEKVAASSAFEDDKKEVFERAEDPMQTPVKVITGEEDEEVESELKGVKLFLKRGQLDFSTGMLGHAKLLMQKTEGSTKRRIVFRRDPLRKVSMNVFLQPTNVRCSFDERDCILRVILQEPHPQGSHSLTVYALKPGRACSRQYFKEFAGLVMAGAVADKQTAG